MKTSNVYISIATILLTLAGTSCNILEEDPEHLLVTSGFYKTEGDAIAAVNSVYSRLNVGRGMYAQPMMQLADLPTDDFKNGVGMNNPYMMDLEFGTITAENQVATTIWEQHYDGINRANAAINRIPEVNMSEDLKVRLVAEAQFLRGLFYFNLVRFFGAVPLTITDTRSLTDLNLSREPIDKVYEQIISDLIFAADNLPLNYPSSQVGRATKGAAKILLGKVYLTRKDWPNAILHLGEVIDNESSYGYALLEDYSDNWNQGTENGSESVFSVQFRANHGEGLVMMRSTAPRNLIAGLIGWEANIPTLDLYNIFDENDERRATTFYSSYEKDGVLYEFPFPLFYKYFDPNQISNTLESNDNVHVLRYADALLMYAEAINEQSGPTPAAYDAINRVRRRAFNDTSYDLSNLTQEQFTEAVYLERRLELALEANRWFDLVRTGRLVSVLENHNENGGVNVQPFHVLMPIPQREIDANPNLEQNDGY